MSSARPKCIPRNKVDACDMGDGVRNRTRGTPVASEYTRKYLVWSPQAKDPIRPPSNGELSYNASAKHDMKTMYGEAYVSHSTPARTKCFKPRQNQQECKQGYLDCLSTYSDNFRNTYALLKRPKPFRPCIDHSRLGMQGDGETLSVSHQTYRMYSVEEFTAAKRNPVTIKSERGGVIPVADGMPQLLTTVQESFKGPGHPPRRQPIMPSSTHDYSDMDCKMELQTTNQREFNCKFPEYTTTVPAIIRIKSCQDSVRGGSYTCRSTFQNDYKRHAPVQRSKSFKPVQLYVPSETLFQQQTLYSDDYKSLPYQGPPKPCKLEENLHLPKATHFQGSTQYTDQFTRPSKIIKRRQPLKPRTAWSSKGRFQSETSYNANFLKHDLSKVIQQSNCKPKRIYEPSKIPFQVQSTAHSHYKGERAPPSKICKPVTKPRIRESCTCVC